MVCFEDVLKLSPILLGLVVLCGCSQRGELVGAASVGVLNLPGQIAVGLIQPPSAQPLPVTHLRGVARR